MAAPGVRRCLCAAHENALPVLRQAAKDLYLLDLDGFDFQKESAIHIGDLGFGQFLSMGLFYVDGEPVLRKEMPVGDMNDALPVKGFPSRMAIETLA